MDHRFASCAVVLACLSLAACSDVELDVLMSRLDPSATVGAGTMSLDFGAKSAAAVELVEFISDGPGVAAHPRVSAFYVPSVTFTYGMTDHAEFALGAVLADGAPMPHIQGKYQWLGAPLSDKSGLGFSLSTTAGAGYFSEQTTDSGWSTGDDYDAELSGASVDLALIGGFRPRSRVMFYGGPFWHQQRYDYHWRRYNSNVLLEKYDKSGDAVVQGINFATLISLNRNWNLQAELVMARIAAERTTRELGGIAVYVGRRF